MTIAMAWTAAMAVSPGVGAASRPSGIGEGWSYWVGRGWGTLCIIRFPAYFELKEPLKSDYLAVRRREVPAWSGVHEPPQNRDGTITEIARGWPALALRMEAEVVGTSKPNPGRRHRSAWIIRSSPQDGEVALPLRPIWPGFAIDTLLFGLIAFGLLFGVGMARRTMRNRAGRCARCGYNLRGLPTGSACPECGATVAGCPG